MIETEHQPNPQVRSIADVASSGAGLCASRRAHEAQWPQSDLGLPAWLATGGRGSTEGTPGLPVVEALHTTAFSRDLISAGAAGDGRGDRARRTVVRRTPGRRTAGSEPHLGGERNLQPGDVRGCRRTGDAGTDV